MIDHPTDSASVSVVLPCRNEAEGLAKLLPEIKRFLPQAEILVVDDGSTDESANVCREFGIEPISHPCSMGNGAAIKTGARHARGSVLVLMDADGQHDPKYIPGMLEKLDQNHEMVVGARHPKTQASILRRFGNSFYNRFASIMTGHKIADLTSGFRVVRARHFIRFLYLLPNGFSYPTTITMAFFRSGLPVGYMPISALHGSGKSHIGLFKDGMRFFLIILKVGALFSPMRVFLPASIGLFLIGLAYYGFTYVNFNRFTNMSAVLFLSSIFMFFIGLIAEQVASLHYRGIEEDIRRTKRL